MRPKRAREVVLCFGFRWSWTECRRDVTGNVDIVTEKRLVGRVGRERTDCKERVDGLINERVSE
jgi:hypothetical protein